MSNWGSHIRLPHLGQHRPIPILHHGMDHRLWVNNDLNLFRLGIKQPFGLNKFQPFIHHGRRVDRNFSPHHPIRVSNRLLWCDISECFYSTMQIYFQTAPGSFTLSTQVLNTVEATAHIATGDLDGDGTRDAATDGLLLLRTLFGFTGNAVTDNALGAEPRTRNDWAAIRSYLNTTCGLGLP